MVLRPNGTMQHYYSNSTLCDLADHYFVIVILTGNNLAKFEYNIMYNCFPGINKKTTAFNVQYFIFLIAGNDKDSNLKHIMLPFC